jgi:hypothetical protein
MVWGMNSSLVVLAPSFRDGPKDQTRNHEIPGSRFARPGMTAKAYRTSSFIAPSRPSIVIGYMRSESSRRMMVVDSE